MVVPQGVGRIGPMELHAIYQLAYTQAAPTRHGLQDKVASSCTYCADQAQKLQSQLNQQFKAVGPHQVGSFVLMTLL